MNHTEHGPECLRVDGRLDCAVTPGTKVRTLDEKIFEATSRGAYLAAHGAPKWAVKKVEHEIRMLKLEKRIQARGHCRILIFAPGRSEVVCVRLKGHTGRHSEILDEARTLDLLDARS